MATGTIKNDRVVYSDSEVMTNKTWFGGRPIYRKYYTFSSLPSSGTTSISLGISNLEYIVWIYGLAYSANNRNIVRPLPFADPSYANNIRLDSDGTNLTIKTGSDWSSYRAYVFVEYTKTA